MAAEIPPPTSYLPPINQISSQDIDTLNSSIRYLRSIYNPEVRGSRRRKPNARVSNSKIVISDSAAGWATMLRELRTDSFERGYAIKWLTTLISHLDNHHHHHHILEEEEEERERIIQDAASLLAICAGSASAGMVVREFMFPYHHHHRSAHQEEEEEEVPICVKLVDISLDNGDYGSVGGQTWGGACVLSEMIVEDPGGFGLFFSSGGGGGTASGVFRILELGAGTGLVSLVVGKLLKEIGNDSTANSTTRFEIVATDYYPSVLDNLRANVENNNNNNNNNSNNNHFQDWSGGEESSMVTVNVRSLDWSEFGVTTSDVEATTTTTTTTTPFGGDTFDLVLGADIVYEVDHATWIRSCLTHLLRKPSSSSSSLEKKNNNNNFKSGGGGGLFHLVIPLRQTHWFESSTVEDVFCADSDTSSRLSLRVVFKDTILCDTDGGEEVEYAYYRIGWV